MNLTIEIMGTERQKARAEVLRMYARRIAKMVGKSEEEVLRALADLTMAVDPIPNSAEKTLQAIGADMRRLIDSNKPVESLPKKESRLPWYTRQDPRNRRKHWLK